MYTVCKERIKQRRVVMMQPVAVSRKVRNYSIADVAPQTGPLEGLKGQRVIVIADVENLSFSAKNLNHGYRLSYKALAERLRTYTKGCSLHAFYSSNANDNRAEYFQKRGWIPHVKPIDIVNRGREKLANSDVFLAAKAGILVRNGFDAVVLATGDGSLAIDIARAIVALPKKRAIFTLSLAGSTSRRLDASRNPIISENIEIGLDVLNPIINNTAMGGAAWKH